MPTLGRQFSVGQQLPLFVNPSELKATVDHSYDRRRDESLDGMWSRKVEEAKSYGLHSSIAEHGVNQPTEVALSPSGVRRKLNTRLLDGHHRVASAADLGKDFIPVRFSQDF